MGADLAGPLQIYSPKDPRGLLDAGRHVKSSVLLARPYKGSRMISRQAVEDIQATRRGRTVRAFPHSNPIVVCTTRRVDHGRLPGRLTTFPVPKAIPSRSVRLRLRLRLPRQIVHPPDLLISYPPCVHSGAPADLLDAAMKRRPSQRRL